MLVTSRATMSSVTDMSHHNSIEIRKWIFSETEMKAELSPWKKIMSCFNNSADEKDQFYKIASLCLCASKDQNLVRRMREAGLSRMNLFLLNTPKHDVLRLELKLLVWSSLNLLAYCHLHQVERTRRCKEGERTRNCGNAQEVFHHSIYLLFPERQVQVIRQTISYIGAHSHWKCTDFVTTVFQDLISSVSTPEIVLVKLIKTIETMKRKNADENVLHITQILSNILEHTSWDKYLLSDKLQNCLNEMLKLYLLYNEDSNKHSSTEIEAKTEPKPSVEMSTKRSFSSDSGSGVSSHRRHLNERSHKEERGSRDSTQEGTMTNDMNFKIRNELKSCLTFFITNLRGNKDLISVMDSIAKCLHDTTILPTDRVDLCEMIYLCAHRHITRLFRESITPDVFFFLVNTMQHSRDQHLVLLCHRVFQQLLDRHDNERFFQDVVYFIKECSEAFVNFYQDADDEFLFRKYSKQLFEGLTNSLLSVTDKSDIIMSYTTICLILVEVPQPVVTINMIHVVITTQNAVLEKQNDMTMKNAHIHATLSSILSLICVIHGKEVEPLAKYCDEVVSFRTENAPHLLPPLSVTLTLASHHTTEYHSQLYYLEEEVFYALQRCWLGKKRPGSMKQGSYLGSSHNNP